MARETIFIVQAFKLDKGARLRPESPISCRSSERARRTAENLAQTSSGVVAFSTSGDAELGDYDASPVIIFKSGQLPASFDDV